MVTWARLRDIWTGTVVAFFNTHFDHMGERARRESAALVLSEMRRIAGADPVVLTGDFNCARDAPPYSALVSARGGPAFLKDAREDSPGPLYGPPFSFNGFQADQTSGPLIDHIFVGASAEVLRAGVLPGTWAGRFVSDHNPVVAEIRLQRQKPSG